MREELSALEQNDVWNVVRLPDGANSLHTKRVYRTKRDANGDFERFKARVNEQVFGRDHNITFAAVMYMSKLQANIGTCIKVACARQARRHSKCTR